jgi:DNA-binding MarR family transcriptional regulator
MALVNDCEVKVMVDEATRECAGLVMETIPLVMRSIGTEMHERHEGEVPMHRFGALMFLKDHRGASLSSLAKHRGSSLSSMSKLIDGLVERGYITREASAADRRRVVLALTDLGEAVLESVRREAVGYLGEMLTPLSVNERATVMQAMDLLRSVFAAVPAERVV